MRKLKLYLSLLMLIVFSIGNVWATDTQIVSTFAKVKNESPTASFSASASGSNSVYATGTTFTITSKESNVWTLTPATTGSIYFSMNNSEGGFHLGSGNYDAGNSTLTSSSSYSNVTQVAVRGKTGKNGSVTVSVKVGNTSLTLQSGSNATFSGGTAATATFTSTSSLSGTVEVSLTDGANKIAYYIESVTITTTSGGSPEPTACVAPSFDPVAGAVWSGTEVALSTTTEGATIYYNMGTNPADPTTESTQYDADHKPVITSATTIKAIAVKNGMTNSSVASASYTIKEPDYTTLAAFLSDQPQSDTYVEFSNDVIITGIIGQNVYAQDASGNSVCIYFANSNYSFTGSKGQKITGLFQAQYTTFNNMPEMKIVSGNEGSIGGTATETTITPVDVNTLASSTITDNLTKYVTLKGIKFDQQGLANKSVTIRDASNNTLKLYDQWNVLASKSLPLSATSCDATGVLIGYKSGTNVINEFLPFDANCINAGPATLPTLSAAGSADAENPTMVPNAQEITVKPATGFTSTLNSAALTSATNVAITNTDANTAIAVTAARDFYTPASATYYFKALPAGTKYDITFTQPQTGGELSADFNQTEAGTTVTLTATPTNTHFTFNNDWTVTGNTSATSIPVTNNQFSMPEEDVTVTGSFTEEAKATLTFAKGEATGTENAPTNVVDYAGSVTLPACPFTYADHYFTGWKKGETDEIYQPGDYTITTADVTAGTTTFTAQWEVGSLFEWIPSKQGYENEEVLSTVCSSPVTITFDQGTAQNAPKYFNNGTNARYYNGGTLTITAPEGKLIKKVIFTATDWSVTASPATLNGKTWTGQAQEVVFTAGATCKITKIAVIYADGVTATLEIDDIELAYNGVATITPKTVTPAAAASTIQYSIKAGSDDCITLNNGQITAKEVTGTATIVATIPPTTDYLGTSIEFNVTVSAPDNRKKAEITSFTNTSGTIVTVTEGTHKDKEYISYAAYQGDGTTPVAVVDGDLRIYKPTQGYSTGGYVVISAVKGCTIDEVQLTNADSKATTIGCSTTSTLATTGTAYAKEATVSFTNLNSSVVYIDDIGGERADITKITVFYNGDPASIDHYALGGTYTTEFEQNTTFSHEGLVVYACYDELEEDKVDITSECTFSEPNMNEVGEQTIEITYNSAVVTSYTITVNAGKALPNLVYTPATQTITKGDAWSAPELTFASGVTGITYESNNPAVATVDKNGVIALAGGYGTAVITASLAENDDFVAGSATYTITVNEKQDNVSGTWNLVTDAADLMPGMQVIIAQSITTSGSLYTLGGDNGNNRLAVADGSATITETTNVLTPATGTKVLTLVDAGNGKFALQLTNGKYLYAAGGTSNNHLKEQSSIDNKAQWSIAIEDGVATIKANITGNNKRDWLRYNSGNNPKIFSCYNSGQNDIAIYAKPFDYTRNVTEGRIGTICLPKAGKLEGAALFQISHMDYESDGTTPHKIYFDELTTNEMEAGRPYIFLPNEGATKLGVYYDDNTAADVPASNHNGLYGTLVDMNSAEASGADLIGNYIFSNNMFYYVNSDVHLAANRAYVKACAELPGWNNPNYQPQPAPMRRISIGNGAPQVATGCENINATDAPVKLLINGQLFILRGEKMYNANGQLVK